MLQYIDRPRDFYFEGSCNPWTESMGLLNFMIVKCKTCGKEFNNPMAWIRRGRGIFCSRKCQGIWRSNNLIGQNGSNWNGGEIERFCNVCGNKFYVIKSRIKKDEGKFCSHKCHGLYKSKNNIGSNNPNWKGGLVPIKKQIRATHKYGCWKKEIFIRDNYTCQKCGLKSSKGISVYLEAHHKIPFHKLLENVEKGFPLYNLFESSLLYQPIWDINNGTTLCIKCHYKAHGRVNAIKC